MGKLILTEYRLRYSTCHATCARTSEARVPHNYVLGPDGVQARLVELHVHVRGAW